MAPRAGQRVLIVDDEEGMREMLQLLLSRHGYQVALAGNGQEALQHIHQGTVDLVLCDVRMPVMDGIELLRQLRTERSPVTVLMMSAFADLEASIEAMKLGALDYISKPFKSDEVLLKIRLAQERLRLEDERERLAAENARLRGEASAEAPPPGGMIGKSGKLQKIFTTLRKVADYKSTVLIIGESGTGKELLARGLHELSSRAKQPFVAINCGAIPETLLESELFGHVKGAFTDAGRDKKGLVEEANRGTLFLDEIGELPLSLQVKLLRFLQEEEIRPVGGTRGVKVDVRIVAATARDLGAMVKEGSFREDLYYRLNVVQLDVPPLRERREDIPVLVEHFIGRYGERLQRPHMTISKAALRVLMEHEWPGNIRELENTIERAMVLSDTDRIEPESLPSRISHGGSRDDLAWLGDELSIKKATRRIERELIRRSLEKTGGNRTRAAELLEISHRALLYKIKDYGLS